MFEAALEAGVSGGPGGEAGLNFAAAGFLDVIGAGADNPGHTPALLTSVATNNSLFEYSNNRRPNNDIRIRIRSFLK